jgi:hypothetical protein
MGNECGNYSSEVRNGIMISVFEDTQEDQPRYYAWVGSWEDHDRATHTRVYRNELAAIRQAENIAKRSAKERKRGLAVAGK